jgi:DMSO/TMAO reductase YedYZ molybdopterin-dependent catalytic subunit
MKLHVRWIFTLLALVTVVGMSAFAAGCGTSVNSTATTVASVTTVASDTTTTAVTTAAADTVTTAAEDTATTAGSDAATSGTITVKGMVDNPLTLTVDALRKMTVVDITAEHPKLGTQQYSGVRFSELVVTLKVQDAATVVDLGCADGYMAEVALADIKASPDSMIAIGKDGTLNGVMPGLTGKAWAKDIVTMEFK